MNLRENWRVFNVRPEQGDDGPVSLIGLEVIKFKHQESR